MRGLKDARSESQGPPEREYLAVGYVLAPWGIQGELKVEAMTDFPERFAPRQRVYLEGNPYTIERARRHGKHFTLKLATIESREAAELLRGLYLEIPQEEAYPLPEGQYYRFQIIGLEVRTTKGETLGTVAEVFPTGSNEVFVVRGQRGELLLPAIEDVVKTVNLEQGFLVIEAIEGLLEGPSSKGKPR